MSILRQWESSTYRCAVTDQGEEGRPSERLGDMLDAFPTWMGPKLTAYRDREQDLPYDMHYFGALIAPRYYLQCEGMQDYWINPIGAWQNSPRPLERWIFTFWPSRSLRIFAFSDSL